MAKTQVWVQTVPEPAIAEAFAQRAEAAGWDGVVVTDSQNLTGDPFVGLAVMGGATERIGLATGVTNPVTRHPAAAATAIATVQEYSGGRAVLGIGRGDSAPVPHRARARSGEPVRALPRPTRRLLAR